MSTRSSRSSRSSTMTMPRSMPRTLRSVDVQRLSLRLHATHKLETEKATKQAENVQFLAIIKELKADCVYLREEVSALKIKCKGIEAEIQDQNTASQPDRISAKETRTAQLRHNLEERRHKLEERRHKLEERRHTT
jgi:hypothetical protein